LTGLYPPKSGGIVLDVGLGEQSATPVTPSNYQQYRNLFTTIFSDFHLFSKLYGVEQPNKNIVNTILRNMGLPEGKTSYKNKL